MCMPASITHSAPAAHYNALPLSLSLSLLTAVAVCCCYIHRHVDGPAAEMALPNLLQLMRSKEGVQGLVEYYTGQPLVDSRVLHISTTSEWKEALDQAGDRPVCALFTNGEDVGCRVLAPVFARLPEEGEKWLNVGGVIVEAPGSRIQAVNAHKRLILEHAARMHPKLAVRSRELVCGFIETGEAPGEVVPR